MKRAIRWAMVASIPVVGCFVPEKDYDQAVNTLRAEQEAHRGTSAELYELRQKLEFAQGKLAEEHSELSSRVSALAESKVELERMEKEHGDATETVEQLRGELARVGDHLRAFSDQKHSLETALSEAEGRASELSRLEKEAAIRGALVRDVTHALHEEVEGDVAAIVLEGLDLQVRLVGRRILDGNALTAEGKQSMSRLASGVVGKAPVRIEVTERPDGAFHADDVIVRLQAVADALAEAGIPYESVTLSLPEETAVGEPASSDASPQRASGVSSAGGEGTVEVKVRLLASDEH
jgi:chaperonin cofactor prefoldin